MVRVANIMKLIRQTCWILLLMLYAAAALKVNSFHALFHSKELSELHSIEQENNPCHKTLYHQQSQKGCEHKSHIVENTKCPLCEYNVTPDQLLESHFEQSEVVTNNSNQVVCFVAPPVSAERSFLSRGPPANV